ncbi:hypothetical protein MNV49_004603 [Pseudohyphozyma bogoriensis]|nr:hypothetical protein MNV49_004603 [Pseudohyphozyma bogoriensis]
MAMASPPSIARSPMTATAKLPPAAPSSSAHAQQQMLPSPPSDTVPLPGAHVGKPGQQAQVQAQGQQGKQDGALFSPSLASILKAYSQDGGGDRDLLIALLNAKSKEDERLAALDQFRAEQLRAANTLASHASAFWFANQQQQQQQAHHQHQQQQAPATPYPTGHSPPSTSSAWREATDLRPSVLLHPSRASPPAASSTYYGQGPLSPPFDTSDEFEHRKRRLSAASDSTSASIPSSSSAHKKARVGEQQHAHLPPIVPSKPKSPHENAMDALRAKCQRNQADAAHAAATVSRGRLSGSARPIGARATSGTTKAIPSPPPRAVALVSSIRSTSGSPPPSATSPDAAAAPAKASSSSSSPVSAGERSGNSLDMLLNAGQQASYAEKEKEKSESADAADETASA